MRTKVEKLLFKLFKCFYSKDLAKRFPNTYKFCNKKIGKFILLLRKGFYPYVYMDSSERLYETSLPEKEAFYSSLNWEGFTNVDCRNAQRVFKKLNIKDLHGYHDLHVQSETLLLPHVSENFRKMYWNRWTWSWSFFISTWNSMASLFIKDKSRNRIINIY